MIVPRVVSEMLDMMVYKHIVHSFVSKTLDEYQPCIKRWS